MNIYSICYSFTNCSIFFFNIEIVMNLLPFYQYGKRCVFLLLIYMLTLFSFTIFNKHETCTLNVGTFHRECYVLIYKYMYVHRNRG